MVLMSALVSCSVASGHMTCYIIATENKDGKTPLDLAEDTSYDECIELVSAQYICVCV